MFNHFIEKIPHFQQDIVTTVAHALAEDIGSGDITAQLIPSEQIAKATVITREDCVFCGQAWVEEVFRQLDPLVRIYWVAKDGDSVKANSPLFSLEGQARSLLTGERTALNFVQTLSGTATISQYYAQQVAHTQVKLDRKSTRLNSSHVRISYAVFCLKTINV